MKYLITFLIILFSFGIGVYLGEKRMVREVILQRNLAEKHLTLIRFYDAWMMAKQKGGSIERYLLDREVYSIAIYGMSYLGVRLFYELKNSKVQVKYGIDRGKVNGQKDFNIISPDAEMEEVDAIIVTAFMNYDEIADYLKEKSNYRTISIDEILYNII